jgi:hypothetical protein
MTIAAHPFELSRLKPCVPT